MSTVVTTKCPTCGNETTDYTIRIHTGDTELLRTKTRLVSVEAELAETKAELAATKAELADTKTRLVSVDAELAATKAELADTKAELTATKAELAEVKAELAATKAELAKVKAILERHTVLSLVRQIAINIEYEFKCGMIRYADPRFRAEFYANGRERQGRILHTSINDIKNEIGGEAVAQFSMDFFGISDENEALTKYKDSIYAMREMKAVYNLIAHPVDFNGETVTCETARQLIDSIDTLEDQQLACELVEKLGAIRIEKKQTKFLYN